MMNKILLKIGVLGILLIMSSCLQEDLIPANKKTMRLFSMGYSASIGTDEKSKAVLLFWEYDQFKDISTNRPFLVSRPTDSINAYKVTPYDTQTLYPPKDNIVAAIGYSPQDLISSKTSDTEDFMTLSLPAGETGAKKDLLTSTSPVYGSTSDPFDREGREPLKFMHAQSKVTFKAIRTAEMNLSIRNVRIELNQQELTGSLTWNKNQERFVTQPATMNYTLEQEDKITPIGQDTPTEIGSVLLRAELNEVPVNITVEKSDDNFNTNIQPTTFSKVLTFTINRSAAEVGKENNRLYAGEAYTFTLTFDKSTLELIGKKEPWEDGGKIAIPIFPNAKP